MSTLSWVHPPARALVVGIDTYDAPGTLIPPLHGAVADARAIYDFLVHDLGLATDEVRLLTAPVTLDSTKATRAAILEGVRSFLADAPQGSEVLFYFAGHGSTVAVATEIAFRETLVESLVPADARTGAVQDILDLEVRVLRAELAQRGLGLTLVVDACYAGDVFRGPPVPTATLVPRLIGPSGHEPRTLSSLLDGTLRCDTLLALYDAPDESRQTLVAACLGTLQCYELRSEAGAYGLLTRAFLNSLRGAGAPLTYTELGRVLPALIPDPYRKRQRPQVTGDVERGVFGHMVSPRPGPCVVVEQVTARNQIALNGGRTVGLTPGSVLTRYTNWSLREPLDSWEVTGATAQQASARALAPVAMPPQAGQPLLLVTPSELPTVWFDPSARAVHTAWGDALGVGLPELAEVATDNMADYIVSQEADAWVVRRRNKADDARLHQSCRVAGGAHELARRLNAVARFDTFVRRSPSPDARWAVELNAPGGLDLGVALAPWVGSEQPLHAQDPAPLASGDRVRLTLTNHTGRDLWCAVYLLDEEVWLAERLFPANSDLHVPTGKTRSNYWYSYDWGGGVLALKVIASRRALVADDAPMFPLGPRDTFRGEVAQRGLLALDGPISAGGSTWTVWHLSLGL